MGGARELMYDQPRARLQTKDGHHAVLAAKAALDVERLPRAALLPFGIAGRVLAWAAERGAFDLTGTRAANIAQREFNRAPDGCVGAVTGAEHANLHVHPEPMADRSVDDDDRRRAGRGRHNAVEIELFGADRFEHRNTHR